MDFDYRVVIYVFVLVIAVFLIEFFKITFPLNLFEVIFYITFLSIGIHWAATSKRKKINPFNIDGNGFGMHLEDSLPQWAKFVLVFSIPAFFLWLWHIFSK